MDFANVDWNQVLKAHPLLWQKISGGNNNQQEGKDEELGMGKEAASFSSPASYEWCLSICN